MMKCFFMRSVTLFTLVVFVSVPQYCWALPQGGEVVAGSATIDVSGSTMNVNVSTNKMIANWQSFSIGAPEAVNFYQPSASSVALNRVTGADPSSILGTLSATGRIFLINPNGVVFGRGCRVDTAGIIASTLNISNEDFLSGRYTFYGPGGSVVNRGYITSAGGYVALLGSSVANAGVIEANLGSIALAAGEAMTLNLDPKGQIAVAVDKEVVRNMEAERDAVENTGRLTANGGKVILTAKALDGVFDRAINTEGIIEAKSLNNQNGEVILEANQRVNVSGTINAEGGTVTVDSQGLDYSADVTAKEATLNANDGDTFIDGGSFSGGDFIATDNLNIFVLGKIDVTDSSNISLIADDDNNDSGDLWTFAGLSTMGGDITLKGYDIHLNGLIESNGGNVLIAGGRDVTHHYNADVYTKGGDFTGAAGGDYTFVRYDAVVDTQGGARNIPSDAIWGISAEYDGLIFRRYLSGSRGYKLTELGYYYEVSPGVYKDVKLAEGTDIGGTWGADVMDQDVSTFEPYAKFRTYSNEIYTWYTDQSRNADNFDHVLVPGEPRPAAADPKIPDDAYAWEDIWGGGDRDYNDAVIDFITQINRIPKPPPTPPDEPVAAPFYWPKGLRVYYEILDPSLFLNFEPWAGQPIGTMAYHPLTAADSTAFDEIALDIGAYEFIENNLNLKKNLAPYFGWQEEEEEKEDSLQ